MKYNRKAFKEHSWKEFLTSLEVGEYDFKFDSINSMESVRSSGTRLNSYGTSDVTYHFNLRFKELTATIRVEPAK